MEKFSNAIVEDRVWSSVYGKGKIVSTKNVINEFYPLLVEFENGHLRHYMLNGKSNVNDNYPTLFWNEFHILTDEEDKKPFDLVEFLKENFDRKFFVKGDKNWQIIYSHFYNEFYFSYSDELESMLSVYIKSKNCNNSIKSLVDKLNENKVTKEQLIEAYKKLEWF